MRTSIIYLLIVVFCLSGPLVASANADEAPAFRLDAGKPYDGKVVMTLSAANLNHLYGYEARLSFDPERLELLGGESGLDGFFVPPIVTKNEIVTAYTQIGDAPGYSGDFKIGTLTFKLKKQGKASVKWESIKIVTDKLQSTTIPVEKSAFAVKGFSDLAGHWAGEDIEKLAFEGIIDGMDEERFVPDAMITRAQFATMLVRALKLDESDATTPFTDVPEDSWYRAAVSGAYAAGLIQGMTENGFAPEEEITREQMTVMIMRAGMHISEGGLKDTDSAGSIPFADASSIGDWAVKDIAIAVREGIVNGRTADTFEPGALATRAEAAVLIKRLLFKWGGRL
ncbi:S-layer homology domain-containing protein [Paenibacillus contaminans]|uniref:SLH domain-containing protein n=1 Tax=Paenibacillus contaminans TaxID=450362 RepID=A0A329LPX3_9BACL|nr:S-layer homology domain-containing protein [Paenibacillus contaminans]RAV09759.1 hypothetical protein DQG23_38960 [Paenibacillus contaminans]